MKRLITIPLFALALLPASAQKLIIEKTTVECGRTGYLQPVTATFELKNKGRRRLIIESVKPDCGCTAVEFPKEVGAGSNFTIKMTYDARQLGHFHKMAAIKSNGSKTPVYLTMRGIVLTEMQDFRGEYPLSMGELMLDKKELEFDDVNKGDVPVQEIHIFNNGLDPMTPNLMHLPPYLSAETTPETLVSGHGGVIKVMLNSEKLRDYGLTQTTVYLGKTLGEKVSSENAIAVSSILLPDLKNFEGNKAQAPQLQISSTDIDFTNFEGKSKKTAEVTLFNAGKSLLKISSLQLFTTGLKVTLGNREIAPGESTQLKITGYAADLREKHTRHRILMITNDPDHAKVVINIRHQ